MGRRKPKHVSGKRSRAPPRRTGTENQTLSPSCESMQQRARSNVHTIARVSGFGRI